MWCSMIIAIEPFESRFTMDQSFVECFALASPRGANGGSCPPPPQLSPDRVLRLSQIIWQIFSGEGEGGGKDNLDENIF